MTALPRLSAPADRALAAAGYPDLESLAGVSARALLSLHGLGPSAIPRLQAALAENGLAPLT